MLNKGYVQVYTGDGKGKTTAAAGLAVRALSNGLKVCIILFLKGGGASTGEFALLKSNFPNVTVISTGTKRFVSDTISIHDKNEAIRGLTEARRAINSREYDVVILDEINVAVDYELIELNEALNIIHDKPHNVELVLTGRAAARELIDAADIVTEMKLIKHYYDKGVKARNGIEA